MGASIVNAAITNAAGKTSQLFWWVKANKIQSAAAQPAKESPAVDKPSVVQEPSTGEIPSQPLADTIVATPGVPQPPSGFQAQPQPIAKIGRAHV